MIRRIAVGLAVTLAVVASTPGSAAASPREQQWYLDKMNVPQAQQLSDGTGVTIGMYLTYQPKDEPDLRGQVLPGRYVNGFAKTVRELPAEEDVGGISTAMVGFAVANGGNGLLGVAPKAKVLPAIDKSFGMQNASCIRWLTDQERR